MLQRESVLEVDIVTMYLYQIECFSRYLSFLTETGQGGYSGFVGRHLHGCPQKNGIKVRRGLTFEKLNPEILFYGTSGRDFMLLGVLLDSNSF